MGFSLIALASACGITSGPRSLKACAGVTGDGQHVGILDFLVRSVDWLSGPVDGTLGSDVVIYANHQGGARIDRILDQPKNHWWGTTNPGLMLKENRGRSAVFHVSSGGVGEIQYRFSDGFSNADGMCMGYDQVIPKTFTCKQPDPPTAYFQLASGGTTATTYTVNFNNGSSVPGGLKTCTWDFGDGATETNAVGGGTSHTYAYNGTYTVKLTITDNLNQTDDYQMVLTVDANTAPVAAFDFTVDGLTVSFTNRSTDREGIASYLWTFGDGTTSTAMHPSKQYASEGARTVTLQVTDLKGATNSTTKTVTPMVKPTADFSYSVYGYQAYFSDMSSAFSGRTIVAWRWQFGDGNTSTIQDPMHDYTSTGYKTVTLSVTDSAGLSSSVQKQIYIP